MKLSHNILVILTGVCGYGNNCSFNNVKEFGGECVELQIVTFRQRMQGNLEQIQIVFKSFVEKFPIIITIYHALSWISLLVFLLSLILFKDSRTTMVQFLWSFYVILQFWLLTRSKTLRWKQYITFFIVGAWVITPFTALFINVIHLIFGGYTSDFWSTAILTPIAEEVFKLIPVLVFLFFSKRTSSLSLTDFMLMGAAVGAGFQFLEETARRLQASTYFPYGHSLFGKALNWDLLSLFPGWFEYEYFPYIMSASHAVLTALMALGIGIALKLRNRLKLYAFIIPTFLFILGTLDHAAWNGDGSMPDWVKSIHDLLGNGYYTKPLLLILLVGAILVDYWRLNKKRDKLIMLTGERTINPFSEVYQLLKTFTMDRSKFFHLMSFYHGRRELGFTLLSGKTELHDRTDDLKGIVEKHYMMLITVAGILLITISALTSELLMHHSENSCFACLFEGLQFWWDRLSGVEKAAIVMTGFALSFPLLGFWSAFGAITTATGIFASGNQIADIIRNPKNLASPEYAMSAAIIVGLNKVPGGKIIVDELLDAGKSIKRLDDVKTGGKFVGGEERFTNGRKNKLKPDIRYKTGEHDYFYETDSSGRIVKFETENLQLTTRTDRLSHSKNTPGKVKGQDHAGHLAGDRFGGSPKIDNLVSQLSEVNLKLYKKIEYKWAAALKEIPPKTVTVDIDIIYSGNNVRPEKFIVKYTVDGESFSEVLLN